MVLQRRYFCIIVFVFLIVLFDYPLSIDSSRTPSASTSTPNIVFIVADDLGFNELGYMNSSRGIRTPTIDYLANHGTSLYHYYTNPLCSPSRSALMTGIYNHRIGTQANVIYWDTPWSPSLNLTFLPQRLKQLQYTTAMYGKWHLGMHKLEYYPSNRGFDYYAGYLQGCGSTSSHIASCCDAPGNPFNYTDYVCSANGTFFTNDEKKKKRDSDNGSTTSTDGVSKDYRGYDWFTNTLPNITTNLTSSSVLIANNAIEFIQNQSINNSNSPFFLYLPFQNIHAPYDCSWDSYAQFLPLDITEGQRIIYGYLYELDYAIQRIIQTLNTTNTLDNTLIIFVSDNGAPGAPNVYDRNYPLAGFKSQVYEGGTRVPAFVYGPRLGIKENYQIRNSMVHVTDWVPTILAFLGNAIDPSENLDGMNIMDSLLNDQPVRNELVVNINPLCNGGQFGAPKAAIRIGDMKLLCYCYSIQGIANATETACLTDPTHPKDWPQLYNLTQDPGETVNIATQYPNIVKQLSTRLGELAVASVEPMQWIPPYQGPNYECADCPLHPETGNPYEPWVAWL